jgi:hypothetical protein
MLERSLFDIVQLSRPRELATGMEGIGPLREISGTNGNHQLHQLYPGDVTAGQRLSRLNPA